MKKKPPVPLEPGELRIDFTNRKHENGVYCTYTTLRFCHLESRFNHQLIADAKAGKGLLGRKLDDFRALLQKDAPRVLTYEGAGNQRFRKKSFFVHGFQIQQVGQALDVEVPGGETVVAKYSDWVLTGPNGERFVLSDTDFKDLYEPA